MDKFVNLHLHTDASLGDSVIKVEDLIKKVEEYGQGYCAITDHSSLMNHYAFQQACQNNGNVRPIFGNEFYCKTSLYKPSGKTRYHLVCLAMNEQGLQNIRKMQRISVKDHFYWKPLLPHPILFENTEGIFVSTACSLSYINQMFLEEKDDKAYDFFNKLLDNFGNKNVAIELQYHFEYKDQSFLNQKLIELYDNTDAKLIINTFDSHCLTDKDRILRKKIQSINWKKPEEDIPDTLKSNVLGNTELCFKFAHESGIEDDNLIQKCIDNTHKIAEKIYFEPQTYGRVIPKFTAHKEFKKIFLQKVV